MGVKLGGLFKKFLEKSGQFKAEKHGEIITKLNELDGDLEDEDVNTISQALITVSEASSHPEVKKSLKETFRKELKSEFLDPVDSELRPYEALLDDAAKTELAKADTSYKKLKVVTGFLAKRGNGDSKDAESYKKKLDELLSKIENKEYIPKADYDKIESQVNGALEGKTMAIMFAKSVPKMTKTRLADKHVNEDYETRVSKLLRKNGWIIDHTSGEIRKASDPDEVVILEGQSEKLTIEDFPDVFFKEYDDWMAKSDPAKDDDIEVERKGEVKSTISEKNRQRAANM